MNGRQFISGCTWPGHVNYRQLSFVSLFVCLFVYLLIGWLVGFLVYFGREKTGDEFVVSAGESRNWTE